MRRRHLTFVPLLMATGLATILAPTMVSASTQSGTDHPHSPPGLIGVSDGHLELNGHPYLFLGVDAFGIGTEWGINAGCGGEESDAQLDQLFSSLAPNSLVRFWAFQGTLAINATTDQLDWAPLDRVFAAAQAYHQRLIVALTDQAGTCDNGHWKDPAWYEGGFAQVYNDPSDSAGTGLTPLSYWTYVQDIVNRYKDSPALGMWEPVNEAEASTCPPQDEPKNCGGHQTCPDEAAAAAALRHFFDVVGGEIHALDPNHLVESGLLGGGQCGTELGDFESVSASPGLDVLSYHDYEPETLMGGDGWNSIAVRIAQAAALGKPIIAGEMGIVGGTTSGCTSPQSRASQIQAKIDAQLQAGSSGALIWDWKPQQLFPCSMDTFPGDPLMNLIAAGPPTHDAIVRLPG